MAVEVVQGRGAIDAETALQHADDLVARRRRRPGVQGPGRVLPGDKRDHEAPPDVLASHKGGRAAPDLLQVGHCGRGRRRAERVIGRQF